MASRIMGEVRSAGLAPSGRNLMSFELFAELYLGVELKPWQLRIVQQHLEGSRRFPSREQLAREIFGKRPHTVVFDELPAHPEAD